MDRRPYSTASSIRSGFRAASQPRTERVSASSRTVSASGASRTWKSGSRPASRAWRRSRIAQYSWNVPTGAASSPRRTDRQCPTSSPDAPASRRWHSLPDALAKLARGLLGERQGDQGAERLPIRRPTPSSAPRNRSVSTVVLPQPAPALSATLAPTTESGRRCLSVSRRRRVVAAHGVSPTPIQSLADRPDLADPADGRVIAKPRAVVLPRVDDEEPARSRATAPRTSASSRAFISGQSFRSIFLNPFSRRSQYPTSAGAARLAREPEPLDGQGVERELDHQERRHVLRRRRRARLVVDHAEAGPRRLEHVHAVDLALDPDRVGPLADHDARRARPPRARRRRRPRSGSAGRAAPWGVAA